MKRIVVAGVLVLLVACDQVSTGERPERTTSAPTPLESRTPQERNSFDRLTIELRLEATTVTTGRQIASQIKVENRSSRPVTDPGCLLNSPSFALVPADDPDAELWGQIVVDCAGQSVMQPGFASTFAGPTFQANDKFGEPLPPGEYIATMRLPRKTDALTAPVEVTP